MLSYFWINIIITFVFLCIMVFACVITADKSFTKGYKEGLKVLERHNNRIKKLKQWKKDRKRYIAKTIK